MKKKNTLLLPGIISIFILISVQVIIIRGMWKQKDEMFNLRYRVFSQDALSSMYRRLSTDGFDTARFIINGYSIQATKDILTLRGDSAIAAKKRDILAFVTKALIQEQDLSAYLSNYFERIGIDKNFNFKIVVNRFDLISNDSIIPVYTSEAFANRRANPGTPRNVSSMRSPSEILVRADRIDRDNYRLDFECLY